MLRACTGGRRRRRRKQREHETFGRDLCEFDDARVLVLDGWKDVANINFWARLVRVR